MTTATKSRTVNRLNSTARVDQTSATPSPAKAPESATERRAREKRLLDEAQRQVLAIDANRRVLEALSKR